MKKDVEQIQKEIKEAVAELEYQYVADRPLTTHPDDWYLRVVLAHNNREHVTWIYNASLGGLHEGHYMMSIQAAHEDFLER
jgi:hypothetical protein